MSDERDVEPDGKDLVKTLRNWSISYGFSVRQVNRMANEAADEIASLRAELDIQRDSQSSAVAKMLEVEQSFENLKAVAGQYLAEIASLRAGIESQKDDIARLVAVAAAAQEESYSLRAKLESARKALENEREFWAGKVASAMIRKLPSSDAQDHVDRITAALTDEKST